jgi:murein DD-endopeptidase MepM/ murein hydrolase activator NlpD
VKGELLKRKKVLLVTLAILVITCLALKTAQLFNFNGEQKTIVARSEFRTIQDKVLKGETLLAIFAKHGLDIRELFAMREVAAKIHPLRTVRPGQSYTVTVDDQNRVNAFVYRIDEDSALKIKKNGTGFEAEKAVIQYQKKLLVLSGTIEDNLISSLGEGHDRLLLALQLSDIFSWDIDFAADLRKGDSFRMIVEGLFCGEKFMKYGDIIAADFVNNGETFTAYRFEHDGQGDYYDKDGNSLRKAFLKAPLNFRRISSGFAGGRLHPILKIQRPHNGVDYAAASGTPVSTIGDGTVIHAGRKGSYGNMVIIRHPNGWKTYYGHLSKISKGIKKGRTVQQGQIIGNVGSTGLSTGPHLHYEVRVGDTCVNPLKIKIPGGWPIPLKKMASFRSLRAQMDPYFLNIEVQASKKGAKSDIDMDYM